MTDYEKEKDNDSDILPGLRSKDERAFEQLYTRYQRLVFVAINEIVKNNLDAEDLMIDTFVKVFLKIDSYAPLFLFRTWLVKIARNTGYDFVKVRKNKKSGDEQLNESYGYSDYNSLDPEEILIRTEGVLTIENRINMLSPMLKKVLIMRCIEDYSYEEIITTLGITGNEARVFLFRARKKLKIAI
jgi:RNA polymerase sigma-70 factor (ECF subfamily)